MNKAIYLCLAGCLVITFSILADTIDPVVVSAVRQSEPPKEVTDKRGWIAAEANYQTLTNQGEKVLPSLYLIALDGNDSDRDLAIRAIGDIRSTNSVRVLEKCLKSNLEGIRDETTIALGKIGDREAIHLLCEAIAKNEDSDMELAYAALSSITNVNSADTLALYLTSENTELVDSIQQSLSKIPTRHAADILAASLHDKRLGIRRSAAEYLANSKTPAVLSILEQALVQEKNPTVRIQVCTSILTLGETNNSLHLLQGYAQNGTIEERCQAITALAITKNDESVRILKRFLNEEDPLVRMNSVIALAQIGDSSVWKDIKKISEHDEWEKLREMAQELILHKDEAPLNKGLSP